MSNSLKRSVVLLTLLSLVATIVYRCLFIIDNNKNSNTLYGKINSATSEFYTFQLLNYRYDQLQFDNATNNVTGKCTYWHQIQTIIIIITIFGFIFNSGFSSFIVPDIVHYILLENPYLEFVTLLSIMSTIKHHQPKQLLIHTDCKVLRGQYWDKVVELNITQSNTMIKVNRIKRPKYIFGKKLSSVYHASDIARIDVLERFGGIYLDNDVYVIKSLHHFRKFEFVIGWPEDQFLGLFQKLKLPKKVH